MTEPIGDTDRTADDPSRSGSPSIAPSILIPRVLAGDLDAFEALYRAHSGETYALCLRMSGDVLSAQELVQDVFVRAWERLASFRNESAFGSWLHRLAVNVVLETFRSDRRRLARVTPEADLTQFPSAVTGGSLDEGMDLDTAISKLPTGARIAFVLHDVEGYTHDEIATLTGLAAGTIRAQVFRARQLLMRTLS
ncbi:MAG: RNA polymerase sigma factor [Gemmatimonadota bacterium]|nr:RNA polymerase sigma factor [Gemmatimonadota bacterium]